MHKHLLRITGIAVLAATAALGQSPKHLYFPGDVPGAPIYALISDIPLDVEYYRDGDWVAVAFLRDPACVPPGFNLLDAYDIPAVFGCTLTIQGFEVWAHPQDPAPVETRGWGLGAVPIYFVSWTELQAAVSDRVLTIGELKALPSLKIGFASFFTIGIRPGFLQTLPGVEVSARGILQDGRQFQFEASGGGRPFEVKHVKIVFR